MSDNPEALPPFDDPRVQAAYRVLCDDPVPPDEQHWEGYIARLIVAALAQQAAAPPKGGLVEAVTKAIMFADCGSTEDWEQNTNLGEAAIRVCDARNPPRCSYCHSSTSAPIDAARQAATPAPAEPFAWGSGDGYWIEAKYKLVRPDADRFTVPFYAAPPATPAAQPADEREAFEAWCVKRWAGDRDGLTRNASGGYHLGPAEFAWSAWQARAALEGR